jgi:hypothetical protein
MLASSLFAQQSSPQPVRIQQVSVFRDDNSVGLELALSSPLSPTIESMHTPDRIVLTFTNAVSELERQLTVNAGGVRDLHVSATTSSPPVTRIVIELDGKHPFTLEAQGNKLLLRMQPVETASASSNQRHNPPAAAASGGSVTGIFHRQPKSATNSTIAGIPPEPVPPTTLPPINFPTSTEGAASSTDDTVAAPRPPSAENPSRGSLQEGSYFPGTGKRGTGEVPPTPASSAGVPPVQSNAASTQPIAPDASSHDSVVQTAADSGDSSDPALKLRATHPDLRLAFKVKYVAEDAAYLDGGRSAGLSEGMKLIVRESTASPAKPDDAPNTGNVAELEVISVADTSAVTSIHQLSREVKPGDYAYLSSEDQEALVAKNALSATRTYPAVISFTEGDTLDEEARAEVPRPPLPSVNRARGRIGFDYMGTVTHGANGVMGSDLGMVVRTDITRIGGTFWNISGYWRGRFSSQQITGQPTLQDLINRTYHLKMTYDNPQSAWVAGFGRMYLPWASSLDTIDGGYFGRRLNHGATIGTFFGSTPDPTSWDYNPSRRMGGAFINFEGGSFDNIHYASTTGGGVSTINWAIDRPFIFFENSLSYKRYLSVYNSLQIDSPSGNSATPAPGLGIGRSFLTVRFQPVQRLELDFNHTYFRDVPTFDPTLIGTGLLDKYLFQGFSGGARVEVVKHIWVYADLGQSNRSGDTSASGNQAFGITFEQLPRLKLRTDFHYSRFSSSFGDGTYKAFSVGRNLSDNLHLEVLLGDQNFSSSYTSNNQSKFLNANFDVNLGAHYFIQTGLTINRGNTQSYDQWFTTFGYRFDSFHRGRK